MSAYPVAIDAWRLPSRGRVGMWCLIAAESAIFTIFLVAYIFYIGKSQTGPQPIHVLHVPIFYTVCLLSSSLTIHIAARRIAGGETAAFGLRMNAGWPFAEFKRTTDFDLRGEWSSEMDQLTERGWASRTENNFQLTPQGLRFADSAAKLFLR